MKRFLNNNLEDIKEIISLTAEKKSLPETIIEKDMWVSYLLDYLFNRSDYRQYLEFKGGTSLSKGYGVIDRFSEDVDIVLDSKVLGFNMDEVISLPSKNQKRVKADELNEKALDFYSSKLIPEMTDKINQEVNKNIEITLSREDLSIYVKYPCSFADDYINSSVKLEIGPLAAWTPNGKVLISSFIQDYYPELCDNPKFPVLVTLPKRTFWEKAVILHQEANRKNGSIPIRYSRHYYDIYKMYFTDIRQDALTDLTLLDKVRDFTIAFYDRAWSEFDKARPGSFKLYPNEEYIEALKSDYDRMKKMIFSTVIPSFEDILEVMGKLEDEINRDV